MTADLPLEVHDVRGLARQSQHGAHPPGQAHRAAAPAAAASAALPPAGAPAATGCEPRERRRHGPASTTGGPARPPSAGPPSIRRRSARRPAGEPGWARPRSPASRWRQGPRASSPRTFPAASADRPRAGEGPARSREQHADPHTAHQPPRRRAPELSRRWWLDGARRARGRPVSTARQASPACCQAGPGIPWRRKSRYSAGCERP